MNQGLGKEEKLKSRKLIEKLFSEGESVKSFPLLAVFSKELGEGNAPKVGFSVSKRRFKKAVDRNRIKRMLREAYRLNKKALEPVFSTDIAVMFIYLSREEIEFEQMQSKMVKLLEKLKEKNLEQS